MFSRKMDKMRLCNFNLPIPLSLSPHILKEVVNSKVLMNFVWKALVSSDSALIASFPRLFTCIEYESRITESVK